MGAASRILPLVTQTHGPSIANNCYWPEIYTNISSHRHTTQPRPVGFDMDGADPLRQRADFRSADVPSARVYIESLLRRDRTAILHAARRRRLAGSTCAAEAEAAVAALRLGAARRGTPGVCRA